MEFQPSDRVRYKPTGLEGTFVGFEQSGGAINWDRGFGPNHIYNPDHWPDYILRNSHSFELVTEEPCEWAEHFEVA